MPPFVIEPATTALVLIDLQRGIASLETQPHSSRDVVARATDLAAAFRSHRALVVLVRVDPGANGELMPRPVTDVARPPMTLTPGWADLLPELDQTPDDVVVTKHQPNAFYGTDLDVHLRRRGIETIVLGGISTNVGVEATARAAHERGYQQVFVEDAMAARAEVLHTHAVTLFFPTIGRVRTARDVIAALG